MAELLISMNLADLSQVWWFSAISKLPAPLQLLIKNQRIHDRN
jgi:hypothetical protein